MTSSSAKPPWRWCGVWALALWFVLGCSADDPPTTRGPVIASGVVFTLAQGEVRGVQQGTMRAWRGLPYAATATGALRFRPPAPHPGWDGTLNAVESGPACAQADLLTGQFDTDSSEDCLRLSIYSPSPAPAKPLPVMVWLHGGAFVSGRGDAPMYDGGDLLQSHSVVLVTVNYRLGAAGFLRLPELLAEDGDAGHSGNVGIQDQVAALRWVGDNIEKFGGDPQNITVFGQAAGATSICALLTAGDSVGLFNQAIIQSGRCHVRWPSVKRVEKQSENLAKAVACDAASDRLACLRDVPIADLVTAMKTASLPGGLLFGSISQTVWHPFVDGAFINQPPSFLLEASLAHEVDVIIGSNRDEARLFGQGLMGEVAVNTDKEYLYALGRRFGVKAHDIVARYPPKAHGSHEAALAAVGTDAFFTCPAARTATAVSGYASAYRYHFEHPPTGIAASDAGVFQGAELPYVFGNEGGPTGGSIEGYGVLVSSLIQRYWVRFATTGDPNGGGDPKWPLWGNDESHISLTHPATSASALKKELCAFWKTIPFHEEPL